VPPAPPLPAQLTPKRVKLVLDPGESHKIPYRLFLPPAPTPLDIYFLVDVSGSMQPSICAMRDGLQAIVEEFAHRGIDVRFGVGQFRGFEDGLPYERLREIGLPDQELVDALASMGASGGTTETQLTALYQAATGEGYSSEQFGDIDRGQQAGFRPEAVHVIVMVTDETFGPNDDDPEWDDVVDALNANSIYQVGVGPGAGGMRHMQEMAAATDALAPPQGVDCDGNGVPDLGSGHPLVCPVSADTGQINLVPTIVGLAAALQDYQPVLLKATEGKHAVGAIAPEGPVSIDVRERAVVDRRVTYTCSQAMAGQTTDVVLHATVSSVPVAVARAEVRCRSVVLPSQPRPPLGIPPVLPPIQPPNVPANSTQPRIDIQSQANQQTQTQAGLVAQRQAQPQTALVHAAQQVRQQLEAEHAMVRVMHDRHIPLDHAKFGLAAGALGLIMAFGLSRVLADQTQSALIRDDSRARKRPR
jgi:hypothetical protein